MWFYFFLGVARFGALYPGGACVTTRCANPGASANRAPGQLAPRPAGPFEALATQSSWGWPAGGSVAFISCPPLSLLSQALQEARGAHSVYRSPRAELPLQCPEGRGLLLCQRRRSRSAARHANPDGRRRLAGSLLATLGDTSAPVRLEGQLGPGWLQAGQWPGFCCWRPPASEGRRKGPGSPSARMC